MPCYGPPPASAADPTRASGRQSGRATKKVEAQNKQSIMSQFSYPPGVWKVQCTEAPITNDVQQKVSSPSTGALVSRFHKIVGSPVEESGEGRSKQRSAANVSPSTSSSSEESGTQSRSDE